MKILITSAIALGAILTVATNQPAKAAYTEIDTSNILLARGGHEGGRGEARSAVGRGNEGRGDEGNGGDRGANSAAGSVTGRSAAPEDRSHTLSNNTGRMDNTFRNDANGRDEGGWTGVDGEVSTNCSTDSNDPQGLPLCN
ncbi:MAG: hypothetical protein H0X26_01120 [Alphaproteobacteria bacterium]|nr:hypothetical protein [Alphaproteobacteria bacterium]